MMSLLSEFTLRSGQRLVHGSTVGCLLRSLAWRGVALRPGADEPKPAPDRVMRGNGIHPPTPQCADKASCWRQSEPVCFPSLLILRQRSLEGEATPEEAFVKTWQLWE